MLTRACGSQSGRRAEARVGHATRVRGAARPRRAGPPRACGKNPSPDAPRSTRRDPLELPARRMDLGPKISRQRQEQL